MCVCVCVGVCLGVCVYLPVSTHGTVDGWSLLGLAEEGVVRVTAPELLTGVIGPVLQNTETEPPHTHTPE